ncbi:MAG TPA: hypothetical protein VHV30_04400 [Polyangiaceae bacterium]|nr:hypothetical protein [Polyangiaceae bacterium]
MVATEIFVAVIVLGGGCGGSSSNKANDGTPRASDAAAHVVEASATDDGGDNAPFVQYEPPDSGGPLQAHIQVNAGGQLTCGGCAVVLAQVQGGQQPYKYSWSDPSWSGPGSFQLCPDKPTPVSLTVTDSSGTTSGEIVTANQTASATTTVDCTAADGSAAPGPLNGCTGGGAVGPTTSVPDSGADSGVVECTSQEVEASVAWLDGGAAAVVAGPLSVTLKAGHAYQATYDQLLPIVLGQGVTVEIWGASDEDVCAGEQLLFTLDLDGSLQSWHETFCFTPDRDYDRAVTKVFVKGVLFFYDALAVTTFCDTCSM